MTVMMRTAHEIALLFMMKILQEFEIQVFFAKGCLGRPGPPGRFAAHELRSAVAHRTREETMRHSGGCGQTARCRIAYNSQFAVECCALPWPGGSDGGTIRLPRFVTAANLTGERDGWT